MDEAIAPSTYTISADALAAPVRGFGRQDTVDLLDRLKAACIPLTEYCEGQVCRGVVSGLAEAFVIDGNTRAKILRRNAKAAKIIKPFLNGRDVRRYYIDLKEQYLIYTYHGVDIRTYPAVEDHLRPFKAKLEARATRQAWYELQQPQRNFAGFMEGPKIIFPDMAIAPRFTLDKTGFYSANTTYFIPRSDLYLLGLLNSRLAYFYFSTVCAGLEGKNETYLRFFGQYLDGFPVRRIDQSLPADKSAHRRMMDLVSSTLGLHKHLASAKSEARRAIIQRQIDATDAQIDRLVYDLYGLTEDEIAIVEGTNK